jgi:hypothetical protein
MRCVCCDRNLNDSESTARHPDTNEFLDTCNKCLREIGITPIIREEFQPGEQVESEYEAQDSFDGDEWSEDE